MGKSSVKTSVIVKHATLDMLRDLSVACKCTHGEVMDQALPLLYSKIELAAAPPRYDARRIVPTDTYAVVEEATGCMLAVNVDKDDADRIVSALNKEIPDGEE